MIQAPLTLQKQPQDALALKVQRHLNQHLDSILQTNPLCLKLMIKMMNLGWECFAFNLLEICWVT